MVARLARTLQKASLGSGYHCVGFLNRRYDEAERNSPSSTPDVLLTGRNFSPLPHFLAPKDKGTPQTLFLRGFFWPHLNHESKQRAHQTNPALVSSWLLSSLLLVAYSRDIKEKSHAPRKNSPLYFHCPASLSGKPSAQGQHESLNILIGPRSFLVNAHALIF